MLKSNFSYFDAVSLQEIFQPQTSQLRLCSQSADHCFALFPSHSHPTLPKRVSEITDCQRVTHLSNVVFTYSKVNESIK